MLVPASLAYGYVRYQLEAEIASVLVFVTAVVLGRLVIDRAIK